MNSTAGLQEPPDALVSSVRYDPALLDVPKNSLTDPPSTPSPYLLLSYHHERLATAAEAFGWTSAEECLRGESGAAMMRKEMDRAVKEWEESGKGEKDVPSKLRLLVNVEGKLTVEVAPTPPLLVPNMFNNALATPTTLQTLAAAPNSTFSFVSVHLDPIPTPASPLTAYKTTSRDHYLASRLRVGHGKGYTSPHEVLLFNRSHEAMECSISNVAFWREGGWVTPREEAGGLRGVMRRWLIEQGRWKEGTVKRGDVVKGEWVLLSNGLKGCFVGRIKE
ncbi:aminotransferase [Leucosporidium creatinivorum]|uniref:Aminotransferase n=1 Tax=Leucosporidium creatinivorum TaxID=106004 RepID=A0A1Y2ET66_9BASI|nr:aminotransferase [Leucosporidium creatinivorum]